MIGSGIGGAVKCARANPQTKVGMKMAAFQLGAAGAGGLIGFVATGTAEGALRGGQYAQMLGTTALMSPWVRNRLLAACFTEEYALDVPGGGKQQISEIRKDDWVLARTEINLDGPVEPKRVLTTFRAWAPILELHLAGGKIIKSTHEHPFWKRHCTWTAVKNLQPGDEIALRRGWIKVEKVVDRGESAWVYNVCVEGYHTYFVGREEWDVSVWAHNASQKTDQYNKVAKDYQDWRTANPKASSKEFFNQVSNPDGSRLGSGQIRAIKKIANSDQNWPGRPARLGQAQDNAALRKAGEAFVRQHLAGKKGVTVLGAFENRAGNGIDVVIRTKNGKLVFFEVKTTTGKHGRSLGPSQRGQAGWEFVQKRLERVINPKGAYKNLEPTSMSRADARRIRNELRRQKGGIEASNVFKVQVTNFDLTTNTGNIRFSRWS